MWIRREGARLMGAPEVSMVANHTGLMGQAETQSWEMAPASTPTPKGKKGKSALEGKASCEKCAAPGEAVAQTSAVAWSAKSGRKQKPHGAHPEAPGRKLLRVSSLRPPFDESAKCGRGPNLGLSDHELTPETWPQGVKSAGRPSQAGRPVAGPWRAASSRQRDASMCSGSAGLAAALKPA